MSIVLSELFYESRHLVRSWRRTWPVVALVALSVGAGLTALASVQALWFRPIHGAETTQLVRFQWTAHGELPSTLVELIFKYPGDGGAPTMAGHHMESSSSFGYPFLTALRARGFTRLAAFAPVGRAWQGAAGSPVEVANRWTFANAEQVSGEYFSTLRLVPALGRLIAPSDEAAGERVAVISYRLWRDAYGLDRSILGQKLRLGGESYEIVGVAAQGFAGLVDQFPADLWMPLSAGTLTFWGQQQSAKDPTSWGILIFAALEPSAQLRQRQQDDAKAAFESVLDAQLSTGTRRPVIELDTRPAAEGLQLGRVTFALPVLLLSLCSAGAFLIGGVTVGTLQLESGLARAREWSVRALLGSSDHRLIVAIGLNSLIIGVLGVLSGCLLAWAAIRTLAATMPPVLLQQDIRIPAPNIDLWTVTAAFVACLLVCVLCDAVPLIAVRRSRAVSLSRSPLATNAFAPALLGFIGIVQVSSTLVLLVVALSLFRTASTQLPQLPTGDADRTLIFRVSNPVTPAAGSTAMFATIEAHLRALPGVLSATSAFLLPAAGQGAMLPISIPDATVGNPPTITRVSLIGGDFFETIGIPVRAGRTIVPRDIEGPDVAVVSQSFARRAFGQNSGVGRQIMVPGFNRVFTVVGIAEDVVYESAYEPFTDGPAKTLSSVMYVPYAQLFKAVPSLQFAVRFAQMPPRAADLVQGVLGASTVAHSSPVTYGTLLRQAVWKERAAYQIAGVFAFVFVLLTVAGLAASIHYRASTRQAEFGIRRALGASPWSIMWVLARRQMVIFGAGIAFGIPGAVAVFGYLRPQFVALPASDPAALMMAAAVMFLIMVAGCVLPGYRRAPENLVSVINQ